MVDEEDEHGDVSFGLGLQPSDLSLRGKLAEPEPTREAGPVPAVLDAFCEAFNARDLDRVTSLLLESAVVEFPGLAIEYGAETARKGSLAGVLFGDPCGDRGFIGPAYREGLLSSPPRLEALLLGWFAHQAGESVRAISRVAMADDRIAHAHVPSLARRAGRDLRRARRALPRQRLPVLVVTRATPSVAAGRDPVAIDQGAVGVLVDVAYAIRRMTSACARAKSANSSGCTQAAMISSDSTSRGPGRLKNALPSVT